MSEKEPLYRVEVESVQDHRLLLTITGERDTVIDTAMRVILDCAPSWNIQNLTRPMFGITATKIQ